MCLFIVQYIDIVLFFFFINNVLKLNLRSFSTRNSLSFFNNDCSSKTSLHPVLRIRIRGIRMISLDPDPFKKMAGSGIRIRIK